MANQPIRALVEAVFNLQQRYDQPADLPEVNWDYTAPSEPNVTHPFYASIRFDIERWCLLHDMTKFNTFIMGLETLLASGIYDGILDNEYDDEMHGVVNTYRECCMAHYRRELES